MSGRGWLAAVCLLAGIPLAAYGLAEGSVLFALPGLVLVLAFWFLAWQWLARANTPDTSKIKPAANAAWGMRDAPVGGATAASGATLAASAAPTPSPSPASGGGEMDGRAARGDKE